MKQLEEIRASGNFNMFTESGHIMRYAYDKGMHELVDYVYDNNWLDIMNELSRYIEIINDFEAQDAEDMFGEYIEDSV